MPKPSTLAAITNTHANLGSRLDVLRMVIAAAEEDHEALGALLKQAGQEYNEETSAPGSGTSDPGGPPPGSGPGDPPPNVEEPEPTAAGLPPDYSWMLALAAPVATDVGPHTLLINSNESGQPFDLTGQLDGKVFVGSSAATAWGEHGPKWLVRVYNAHGVIEDLAAWRVGDFHKGREGHVVYANVLDDLTLRNVVAVQCGGQFGQFVWRPSETKIPVGDWPQGTPPVLRIIDCEAHDCGAINEGTAVRASWPLSFYNPGHSLVIDGFKVRTELPVFNHAGKHGDFRSHGGLFVGPGQVQRRCPKLQAGGLDIAVSQSDRELVRLWMVDEAVLTAPRLVHHGGEPRVSIVEDCEHVVIDKPVEDVVVHFHRPDKAYGMSVRREVALAGKTWEWSR